MKQTALYRNQVVRTYLIIGINKKSPVLPVRCEWWDDCSFRGHLDWSVTTELTCLQVAAFKHACLFDSPIAVFVCCGQWLQLATLNTSNQERHEQKLSPIRKVHHYLQAGRHNSRQPCRLCRHQWGNASRSQFQAYLVHSDPPTANWKGLCDIRRQDSEGQDPCGQAEIGRGSGGIWRRPLETWKYGVQQ